MTFGLLTDANRPSAADASAETQPQLRVLEMSEAVVVMLLYDLSIRDAPSTWGAFENGVADYVFLSLMVPEYDGPTDGNSRDWARVSLLHRVLHDHTPDRCHREPHTTHHAAARAAAERGCADSARGRHPGAGSSARSAPKSARQTRS